MKVSEPSKPVEGSPPPKRAKLAVTPPAPQPYWIKNPAGNFAIRPPSSYKLMLLRKQFGFVSALLSNNLPLKHSTQGDTPADGDRTRELSPSERRLLLSGKMQRVLDKACHGDAKRFRECNDLLDDLERLWAKEDSMV